MSGVQALVKLPMLQRLRDAQQGKNTAGFISGYRGSPLGGYDQALWKASKYLKAQNIVFQPGVNEELAATALWGTQQLGFSPKGTNKFDGVFGIWYGKGPGVDRCADVFKHANMAGTSKHGGAPERPHLQGLWHTGVLPDQRAGDPRPGYPRVCDEPFFGCVVGHEDDPGDC